VPNVKQKGRKIHRYHLYQSEGGKTSQELSNDQMKGGVVSSWLREKETSAGSCASFWGPEGLHSKKVPDSN